MMQLYYHSNFIIEYNNINTVFIIQYNYTTTEIIIQYKYTNFYNNSLA